jgi:hypothetical protein
VAFLDCVSCLLFQKRYLFHKRNPMDDITTLKEEEKEKLEWELANEQPLTQQPREQRFASRRDRGGWSWGLILIGVGAFMLVSNLTDWQLFENWWALFILMPAFYNFSQAWRAYRRHGRFTDEARGNLVGGLMIGTVASFFLFGLSWGTWWPLFMIIGGIGSLLGGWWR